MLELGHTSAVHRFYTQIWGFSDLSIFRFILFLLFQQKSFEVAGFSVSGRVLESEKVMLFLLMCTVKQNSWLLCFIFCFMLAGYSCLHGCSLTASAFVC